MNYRTVNAPNHQHGRKQEVIELDKTSSLS